MAREDPTFVLNDGQGRVPPHARAQVVEFSPEELARLNAGRKGLHSQVIDRNRPIQVIRGEGPEAPRGTLAAPAPAAAAAANWGPVHRDATDDLLAQQGVITVSTPNPGEHTGRPVASNAIVIPYSAEQLKKAGVAVPTPPPTVVVGAPSAPPSPTTLDPVVWSTAKVVPSPPAALPTHIAQPSTQAITVSGAPMPAGQLIKRETVILSSPTIGKHRLKVTQVLISATIIVLVYEDNDDTTIYEPPDSGSAQPLLLEYGADKYECAYYGQSVTQQVLDQPGRQLLLVVLVRV